MFGSTKDFDVPSHTILVPHLHRILDAHYSVKVLPYRFAVCPSKHRDDAATPGFNRRHEPLDDIYGVGKVVQDLVEDDDVQSELRRVVAELEVYKYLFKSSQAAQMLTVSNTDESICEIHFSPR